jgi:hypothetical protein
MLSEILSTSVTTLALALLPVAVVVATALLRPFLRRLSRVEIGDIRLEVQARESELLSTSADQSIDHHGSITYSGDVDLSALSDAQRALNERLIKIEETSTKINARRVALLETYHNQGLAQSRVSFWFSLALATAGFGLIAFAIMGDAQSQAGYISGVVTEAVSALIFAESNRSRRLMADFFDKLRADQRREDSVSLARQIEDPRLRGPLQAVLAMELMSSKFDPSVLSDLRNRPGARKPTADGTSPTPDGEEGNRD